ncbi:hypothetical protein BST81_12235 [Leptolyngbya sp. 'hensonii']|uniref:hypothetical protein n=1 Tax=Leptolyngbya sp. 'hensonii' TaxID=1922337 RepID=UPI00094FD3BC|nr:hypothetical protein [Leptolyngbya sp. 'hensonii']OLP17828.1 hypothetical protein BST81_12235 [Leptolyngbya sp. 'hensonii']
MAPTYLFLLALSLGVPLYVTLRAMAMVIPAYTIFLAIAGALIWVSFYNPKNILTDDIILCLVLLISSVCGLIGFAIAPLSIQMIIAIGLVIFQRKYFGNVRG